MKTEIITIGDELLIGQTINTNAAWLGQELSLIGIKVNHSSTISDEKTIIYNALSEAEKRSNLIIITGGLGPTKDDITKAILCDFFNTELVLNHEVLEDIKAFFTTRNVPFLEVNKLQAMLPKSCVVIRNKVGTASGMWFEKNEKIFISMPGVPYEMKHLMKSELLTKIKNHFSSKELYHRTIITHGKGESYLAEKVSDWENELRNIGLDLAYLPSPGIVRMRISSKNNETELVNQKVEELYSLIPDYIFGENEDTMALILGKILLEKNKTISLAESCTGGYTSHLITEIPGCSKYFEGSIICYSYDIKEKELNIPHDLLVNKGAVSQEITEILSLEVQKKYKTDCSIAISGIAGPDGGTDEKPVGTVWITVRDGEKVVSKKFNFGSNRERNIKQSAISALNLLRLLLINNS